MKLKIGLFKTTLTYIITMLIVGGIVFLMFFKEFIKWPWSVTPWILTIGWLIGAIVFYIITIVSNYYVLHKKYVSVFKYRKELVYNFSEIIYIDEEQSEKKKVICFVTNKLHVRYLNFDKDNVLYPVMLQKCNNRLDKETFTSLHPDIKI